MNQHEPLLSIQQLSERLSIPKPTLRFWEKELEGIIVPLRTRGGQRRYTLENISTIEEVNKLRMKGMSLAEIKKNLDDGNRVLYENSNTNQMDLLLNRIAEVVKTEVSNFFQREELK